MAGQVDGYGPDEFDDLHWDLLLGGIVTLALGIGILAASRAAGGPASKWVAVAGGILIMGTAVGCAVSSRYRRYAFLTWWRKGIILIPGAIGLVPKATLIAILDTQGRLPRQSDAPPVELDVAVDDNGAVYSWDSWRGTWRFRADSLEGIPAKRLRIKRTIFGPVEPPPHEETHVSRVDF